MKITVIIPTYKSWDLLAKCLEALSQQSYSGPYEVIVVNNDVLNDIPDSLKIYDNVIFYQESKPGSYAARNKGIKHSTGEILAFTDADCIPQRNWLKAGVEELIRTNAGIVGGDVKLFFIDPQNPTAAEIYDNLTGFDQKGYIKEGHCITANWFSFKSVIEECGGFNSDLKSNGDSELSGKISKKYKVLYEEDALVLHPARSTTYSIITKYRRLLGGTYDRVYRTKKSGFGRYVINFIFRRIRFNLNLFYKMQFRQGIKVLYIHFLLFPALVKEYFNIIQTGETERL